MLAKYLKSYFQKEKITHYEIADEMGINQSKVNMSLNGKRKLTAEELIMLAIKFDLDLNKIKKEISTKSAN